MEKRLLAEPLTRDLLRDAKRLGFTDVQVGALADLLPEQVRDLRKDWDLRPVYKMVDTCAAEFDAVTPYFYSTYEEENEAPALEGERVLVIGSGPIRIGQGIEFDYCSVHAVWALQEAGYKALIANSNPETVSTDFDTSDRLYFEPLDEESVRDILENEESADGVGPGSIVQFGGQTAINLAEPLYRTAREIVGSSSETHRPRRGPPALRGLPQQDRRAAAARRRHSYRRRGAGDGAGDRLSGARATQLRARRARHGDRAKRD